MFHKMTRLTLCVIISLSSASCVSENDKVKFTKFDSEIDIATRIASSGGQLGDETYKISTVYRGETKEFFRGTNPRKFSVSVNRDNVKIVFCDGNVKLAQPIFLGPEKPQLIHVDLITYCPNAN
jgi:hypothetical protein